MSLLVMKFGGTSVGSPERIRAVAARVARAVADGHQCAVIVSAMGHTTDELVGLAAEIAEQPDRREMDALLATGEQIATALVAMALHETGVKAASFTGWQAGIQTEPVHGAARIETIDASALISSLHQNVVPVIAGFQGVAQGAVTTLGRGGSDTTAVAVAAALHADRCEIYTDVSGVYTADPRLVQNAQKLMEISYEEMLELANLGSQVLHPRAVETAKRNGVALVVRSSFSNEEGTVIRDMATMERLRVVTGVACEKEVARVALLGMTVSHHHLADIFSALAQASVNVDVIVQSVVKTGETDVSFTVSEGDVARAVDICEEFATRLGCQEVKQETGLSKISIVGAGMISNPGVAAHMFQALAAARADIKMVSTSEIKVSCIIAADSLDTAVQSVHDAFSLAE